MVEIKVDLLPSSILRLFNGMEEVEKIPIPAKPTAKYLLIQLVSSKFAYFTTAGIYIIELSGR